MKIKLTAAWLLCLLLMASSLAFGQITANSAIAGSVLDKSGAAIVGAEVTVSSSATGFSRTVKTTDQGTYRIDPLPAGIYKISAAMGGFGTAEATKIETAVGATTTQNFSLSAGTAKEVVEVTTEAPLVDQTKTDVSLNISPSQVQELPLIGRDVADLAYLAPGVKAADSYDPTKNRYAILSVNGQGGRNVNVTVNGVDNKDNTVGGPVMQLPLEGVQEFSISTQRFDASNGRSEGAAINLITKSGSNNFHGSAFGFFREQAFNADQKQPNGDGTTTAANPPYSRQFFGGALGGPFVKDKLFGFFAFERQRENTSIAEDPTALSELQLVTGLGAQPSATIPTPFFENRYTGRADYRFNDRESAYFSVSLQANNSLNDQSNATFDTTEGNFTTNHMQIANLTLNSALSNTLVNQATVGFQYWNNVIDSKTRVPLITFPSAQFGTNTNVPQQSFQRKYQFKDDLTKTLGNHTFKLGGDYIYNPTLGGYFEFSSTLEVDFNQDPSCILGVGKNAGTPGCGPGTFPNAFSTPGLISNMTVANGDPTTTVPGGTKQLGFYFQDDWKATRRLTLNLGLRWDKDFNMVGGSAVHNSRTYQQLVAIAPISPLAQQFSFQQPQDDNKDFSPRVGFAYDVTGSGKHILRGGFGMYYGNVFQNIPIFMEQQHNATIFQGLFSVSGSDIVPGTGITVDNYRFGVDPSPTIAPPSSQLAEGSTGRIIDPKYRNPVTEEANIGYSWALGSKSVLEAEYVHVLSLHENKTVNVDPRIPLDANNIPDRSFCDPGQTVGCTFFRPLDAAFASAGLPILGSVRDEQSIGRSRYDGLNLSYRQRLTHSFSLNANYTLARALSYGGGGGSFRNYPRDPQHPLSPFEFGPTVNDERHHVTLSGIVNLPFGLEFAPILQAGSARPYNIISSYNQINAAGGSSAGAVVVPNNDPKNYFAFQDTSGATKLAAAQCYYSGNCHVVPFNSLRGDPYFDMDARLAKNIKFGERANLQLSFQAFNLFNHANYGNNFDNTIQNQTTSFGRPIGFINPTSTVLPRAFTGEFGARFSF